MRRLKRVAVFAATAIAVLAPAGSVLAHAGLEASVPAANAVLESGPPNIVLDFNEAVDAGIADIELYDQTAALVPTGLPRAGSDDTVVQAAVPTIADGVYVVVWRVPSDDGHVVDGVFSFQVGVESGFDVGALIDKVSGTATASSTVGRLDTASRLLALIGLIVIVGGGVLAASVKARAEVGEGRESGADDEPGVAVRGESGADDEPGVAHTSPNQMLLWMAWVFLLAGTLGMFGLYGAKVVAGSPADAFDPSVWSKIVGSHTATVLIVRMVLVVALGGLLLTFRDRTSSLWRAAAIALAAGLVLTFSTIGHANTQHPAALWIGIDALHVTALSLWIGGLVMFAFGAGTWLTDAGNGPIVRRFSATAVVAVPVIVATGVAQTLKLAGGLDDLTSTSWGRTLLVKVAVVTVLIALGGVSQWLLRHDGPSALKRNVLVESLIGIAVIGLAAGLVALPPQAVAASKVFSATLTNQGVTADVTVTPGRVGQNEVHLVITPPGGSIDPVVSTSVQATPPSGTGVVPATLQSIGPNHYTGTISLTESGDWSLQITVAPSPGLSVELSSVVAIPG